MISKVFLVLTSIFSGCNSLSFNFSDNRITCYYKNQKILCPAHLPQIICDKKEIWLCKPHNPHPKYFYQTKIKTSGIKEFDSSGKLINIYKPKYKAHVYIYKIDF
jgi:hypothetical protein